MEMSFMISNGIQQALMGACYLFIAYVLMYFNKWINDICARFAGLNNDYAIEEESNLPVALRSAGLYLGVMLGMYGVISGPSHGIVQDLWDTATYGLLVSVFMVIARYFNDRVVLGSINNTKEVQRGNLAVGIVECGAFIATGIIAQSSMAGLGGGYATAVGFFIIGQVALLAVTVVYEFATPWSVHDEIAKGNAAAGLRLAGIMVAIAVALSGAIGIDFESWEYNLTILGIDGGLAILFMTMISYGVDRIFFSGTDIQTEIVRDRNVAAISVVTALQIAGALAISAAVV
jgi:uncharacterized membrane protein YjfL (UPF0719 family)